jgi:sulfur carrier protein ThiS adenylyltransferase
VLSQGLQRHWKPDALAVLASARVGIAGAGGLGSNVAMLLVRSGIRNLLIVDYDCVEPSNLNRQCYWPEDVGKSKVEALRVRLLALEPELKLDVLGERITAETACALFRGCAIVVEALDEAVLKAALCASLLAEGFYVVAASGIGGYGMAPMQVRRMGESFVCVGDFVSAVDENRPPLAPRVMQAAALQADAVLARILAAGEIPQA